MARRPQLNWNEQRQCYQFNFKGKRYRPKTTEEAESLIDSLLAQEVKPVVGVDWTVAQLCAKYLDHLKRNKSGKTYIYFFTPLDDLATFVGKKLKVSDLRMHHVTSWLETNWQIRKRDGKPLSENGKRQPKRAIMAMLNWSSQQEYIAVNPLKGKLVVGKSEPSQEVVEDDQWKKLVAAVKDQNFLDLLTFQRLTGCRPFEARQLEARHIVKGSPPKIVLPKPEAKGKKRDRIILLCPEAWALLQKRLLKHPEGPLFRNSKDIRWTPNAVRCRMERLEKHLGFKIKQKTLRHSWATEYLMNGGDVADAAALMGHVDPTMILTNYQHLFIKHEHLYEKLTQTIDSKKITNPSETKSA